MNLLPEVLKTATLSDDRRFRYALTRQWGEDGSNSVLWIMLNPSTADDKVEDHTLLRCRKFSESWGFDRLKVVNLYPYRTPKPEECSDFAYDNETCRTTEPHDRSNKLNELAIIMSHNWDVMMNSATAARKTIVAWGNTPYAWDIGYVESVTQHLRAIDGAAHNLMCLGHTIADAPIHPLARGRSRVPDETQPTPYRSKV